MKKLLISLMMVSAVFAVSGCSVKTVKSGPTCVGCENLPECVPGPYGDCIKK